MRWLLDRWRDLSPPTLLVTSFLALIAIGAAGLLTLPGLYTGASLGLLDAIFTLTSAVCVTGLVVVDTATYFTFRGQLWILLLIQLGGLGLIALATLIIGGLGRRLSLRSAMIAAPPVRPQGMGFDVVKLTIAVAKFTLFIEALGALVLWVQWIPRFGARQALWHAVFHSVSAFCNAGFSTFTTSLVEFADRPGILVTMSLLVIVGGLGYLASEELLRWYRAGGHHGPRRLSSHTFAVVLTTGVLLTSAAVIFTLFEWGGVLADFGFIDKLANAWFMSVTPRTAGFNSVSYAEVGNESAFLTILLMIVGGSPGSTAGGIKTTTLAILVALSVARIRGRRNIELHARTVPDETVERTVSLALMGLVIVIAAIFLLTVVETRPQPLEASRSAVLPVIFEAVSAFGTVGLSMDLTPSLPWGGRVVAIGLMFLGRIGPLAFFAALSVKSSGYPRGMRAAREDVIVG